VFIKLTATHRAGLYSLQSTVKKKQL